MLTAARATPGPGQPFQTIAIERREVGEHDVLVEISYAGICHSDVSHARCEWGPTLFPLVPGHEIAGTVTTVGTAVTSVAAGQHVGIGVMVDSCGVCDPCRDGTEQHCVEKFIRTYNWRGHDDQPTHGGYSQRIVVNEGFVAAIPDGLALQHAAPLMCSGITMYSPLRRWGIRAGSRVGVIGLGGLGHVGVQIAAALGAEVVVFERDQAKRQDAYRFGATDYVCGNDRPTGRPLDLILSTVPADLDLNHFLSLLAVEGVFVNIGVPQQAMRIDAFTLLTNNRVVAGSSIGGMAETRAMLRFCAEHRIAPEVEMLNATDIDDAYARLDRGDVRYRFVIDVATISSEELDHAHPNIRIRDERSQR